MTTDSGLEVAPWRYKLQAMLVLFTAIAGTIAGGVLVYFDHSDGSELRAYESAVSCPTASDALNADTCRFAGLATVTGTTLQSTLAVDLSFSSLPGHIFVATFPLDREPDQPSLRTGATVSADLWNGQVTDVAGVKSVQNPEFLPQNLALAGWIFVVAGAGLGLASSTLVRRAWSVPPGPP